MNKIETIKIGDIEVPVEYLRQTTVNVNGDDYIRLQQENKQLKDNWNKLKEYCQNNSFMQNTREYGTLTVVDADELAIYIEELESGDSNE